MLPIVNQVIFLNIVSDDEALNRKTFKGRVAEILSDHLFMERPIDTVTRKIKIIPEETQLNFWYITSDGAKVDFKGQVIGSKVDRIPLVKISLPPLNTFIKVQRRHFLRVPTELELSIKIDVKSFHFLAKTRDLSGGGLSFSCNQDIPIDPTDSINGWLVIPNGEANNYYMQFTGQVIRVIPPYDEGFPQIISVQFVTIKSNEQQYLIRYCFERQIELRKRGYYD